MMMKAKKRPQILPLKLFLHPLNHSAPRTMIALPNYIVMLVRLPDAWESGRVLLIRRIFVIKSEQCNLQVFIHLLIQAVRLAMN